MRDNHNLPMVFGTETEFGFSFGRVLDETMARYYPADFPEKTFHLIIKYVSEKVSAFIRNPCNPWERAGINQLGKLTIQKMAEAATSIGSSYDDYDLPERFRGLISKNIVSLMDYYMGEIGIFLPNASRLYIDGAHLEYSIGECRNPYEVVCQEKAMEMILAEAVLEVQKVCGREIFLFKNNTDYKGHSYACHSNYSLKLEFFNRLYEENIWSRAWLSFIATSIIFLGSGKVGYENGEPCSYQISQRADHMLKIFGTVTLHDRPMINLRSEPLADPDKWGRFHVILDDSNMSEWSIYLKVGTKALVLNMLQHHYLSGLRCEDRCVDIDNSILLNDPLKVMKFISRDLTCKKPLSLSNSCFGYSALEIQKRWLALVKHFYENQRNYDKTRWIFDVIKKWGQVLEWIENEDPILDSVLDWRIKKRFVDIHVERRAQRGLLSSIESSQSLDLSYHDIGAGGLYNRLSEINRFARNEDIVIARFSPSENTRAWFRGQFIKHFPQHLIDVSWELLIFDIEVGGFRSRVRLEPDPILSNRLEVGIIFDKLGNYEEFCRKFLDLYLSQRNSF